MGSFNAALAVHQLVIIADELFAWLYGICSFNLKVTTPTFGELNHLVSAILSGVTCSLRSPTSFTQSCGNSTSTWSTYCFYVCTSAWLSSPPRLAWLTAVPLVVLELTPQRFHANKMTSAADPRHSRNLTAAGMFCPRMSTKEVDTHLLTVLNKSSSYFVNGLRTAYDHLRGHRRDGFH